MTVAFAPPPRVAPEVLLNALFRPLGVDGVLGRTGTYESVVEALAAFITRRREQGTEILRLPPVVPRKLVEKSGYLKSFPNLLGCVCGLSGGEAEITAAVDRYTAGGTWTDAVTPDDLVLAPAACYPVYPMAAARGPIPVKGLVFDVACDCFRREPSRDIDRFQSFRMREYVYIGSPEGAMDFRARWMARGGEMADALGLDWRLDAANDPFFGRGGKLVARAQVEQQLKFELLVPVRSAESPTACMSFNLHRDHFGTTWEMQLEDGGAVHTACAAWGMDRLALALFARHGLEIVKWPTGVRAELGL